MPALRRREFITLVGGAANCCRAPQGLRCSLTPNNATTASVINDLRDAALAVGAQIDVLNTGTSREIDMAFASLVHKPMDALLVSPDPVLSNRHVHLVLAAMYHRIPAIYFAREFVEGGGTLDMRL